MILLKCDCLHCDHYDKDTCWCTEHNAPTTDDDWCFGWKAPDAEGSNGKG